jgi:mRNA deadenylase 3'-5' endonuclease subunit Ccr4
MQVPLKGTGTADRDRVQEWSNFLTMAKRLPALPVRNLQLTGSVIGAELASSKQLEGCFTVLSFNMLAQCYTRSEFFPSVNPQDDLQGEYRGPMIIKEITQYNPDIV